jgi:hypothetical protein
MAVQLERGSSIEKGNLRIHSSQGIVEISIKSIILYYLLNIWEQQIPVIKVLWCRFVAYVNSPSSGIRFQMYRYPFTQFYCTNVYVICYF